MRIRQDLPIEEQERLQREYMEMSNRPLATLRPLGSRTGLDSMFNDLGQPILRPADQAAPTKDIYDSWTSEQKSEWDRYGEFGKPQLIDMPRPPVMLPLPGQENPYPVDPIRPEVMPRPGIPEVTPRPGPQPMLQPFKPRPLSPMQTPDQLGTLTSLLPRDPNRFAQTMRSDEERLRPPSIQLSRKHGGSLSQTVLNLLRNLS